MPAMSTGLARTSIRLLIALYLSCFCFAQSGSDGKAAGGTPRQGRGLEVSCSPESPSVHVGQSVKVRANAYSSESNLIYSFGSDRGTITVNGNEAILSTALLGPGAATVHVVCSVLTMGGQTAHANAPISLLAASTASTPSTPRASEPPKSFNGTIAPTLSWIASTQTQKALGGNAAIGFLHAKEYCDPRAWQIGVEGNASNTTTQKPGSSATQIDTDDARLNGLAAIGPQDDPRDYLGGTADFFLNNSLGIGLQQTYTAEYRHYLMACPDVTAKKTIKQSLALGAGSGYTIERLYKTTGTVTSPVTPLSAQYSWSWWGNVPKKGVIPATQQLKLSLSFQAAWMPLLTDSHAYQAYERSSVSVPTTTPYLQFTFDHLDYYVNNAPPTFKRNYQNIAVGLKIILHPDKNPLPTDFGACWSGDQIKRLSCMDDVERSQCTGTSVFERSQRCSEIVPLQNELNNQ